MPAALGEPAERQTLVTEARVRAGHTSDATAGAAGSNVEMIGPVPHVMGFGGNEAAGGRSNSFGQRRPDVVLVKEATPAS